MKPNKPEAAPKNKRQFITEILENGITEANKTLASSGLDLFQPSLEEKEIIIDKMENVCSCSAEDFQAIEDFLNSEQRARHLDAVGNMSKALFEHILGHPFGNDSESVPENRTLH